MMTWFSGDQSFKCRSRTYTWSVGPRLGHRCACRYSGTKQAGPSVNTMVITKLEMYPSWFSMTSNDFDVLMRRHLLKWLTRSCGIKESTIFQGRLYQGKSWNYQLWQAPIGLEFRDVASVHGWMYHNSHYKVWHNITYPSPNFNGCTVEVWEWISDFTPHFIGHVITYPC